VSKSGFWKSVLIDRIEGSNFDVLGWVRVVDGPNEAVRLTEADDSSEFHVTYKGTEIYTIERNHNRYPSACWATLEYLYCLMVEVDQREDGEISARYVVERVDATGHLGRCGDLSSYQDPAGLLHFQRIDRSGGFVFMFNEGGSAVEGVIDIGCLPP
jgi:hypothetical protein